MKVLSISTDVLAIAVTPIGNRYYKLAQDTVVSIATDEGVYRFFFAKGFVTNFRSGGILVDSFVDQIGDEMKALCYLFHDAVYTPCAAFGMEHTLSRSKGDLLLREALKRAGMPSWKASLVYRSVRMFGKPAYTENDWFTEMNSRLFRFEWSDR